MSKKLFSTYAPVLETCQLFNGVEQEQYEVLLNCLGAHAEHYDKNEFIFNRGDEALYVGVVLKGTAHIIQEDFWGNRTIIASLGPGEIFGESLSSAHVEKLPVSVVAIEAAIVMLIDYKKITTTCSQTCVFHSKLIANMLEILAQRNVMLTRKVEFVTQRTTREKILAYLSSQALQNESKTIVVPFNRQELADYLCVDRSALSRELSEMQKEGILAYDKNTFKLN